MNNLGGPVSYLLFLEHNEQGKPYFSEAQGAHGTTIFFPGTGEQTFIDAWRHIRVLADNCGASIDHGGNVIFVWGTGGVTSAGYAQNYYPGDDYVDFIGHDLYRGTFSHDVNKLVPDNGVGNALFYSFAQGTESGSNNVGRVEGVVKPMIVPEGGYDNGVNYPDNGIGGDGLNYRKDSDPNIQAKLLADLQGPYINVVIYMHWNVSGTTPPTHYNRVDQSPASLSRYLPFANSPFCNLYYTP